MKKQVAEQQSIIYYHNLCEYMVSHSEILELLQNNISYDNSFKQQLFKGLGKITARPLSTINVNHNIIKYIMVYMTYPNQCLLSSSNKLFRQVYENSITIPYQHVIYNCINHISLKKYMIDNCDNIKAIVQNVIKYSTSYFVKYMYNIYFEKRSILSGFLIYYSSDVIINMFKNDLISVPLNFLTKDKKNTYMHLAYMYGHNIQVINILYKKGIMFNNLNNKRRKPLYYMFRYGSKKYCKLGLAHIYSINKQHLVDKTYFISDVYTCNHLTNDDLQELHQFVKILDKNYLTFNKIRENFPIIMNYYKN
jgi:hypothetical protein